MHIHNENMHDMRASGEAVTIPKCPSQLPAFKEMPPEKSFPSENTWSGCTDCQNGSWFKFTSKVEDFGKGILSTMDMTRLSELAIDAKIPPEEFLRELWRLSKSITRRGRVFTPKEKDPIKIFRARAVDEIWQIGTDASRLSYPPASACSIGRANVAGEAVFYASAGMPTTFIEMKNRVAVGGLVVVSEWRSIMEIALQEVGFKNGMNSLATDYESLMHRLFTHPGDKFYPYSSQIAKHLMTGTELGGIIYPSIESGNLSENVAIKPQWIDEKFFPVNASLYKVTGIHPGFRYDIGEIDFGTIENGKIDWKGRCRNWQIRKPGGTLTMKSNGWAWEGFDNDGNLIDPE